MIRVLSFVLIIILTNIAHGRKEMAITIDDLPFLYGRYLPDSIENAKFRNILTILKNHKIQTIGFAVGSRIKAHDSILLDEFIADGHIIGNPHILIPI